MLPGLVLEGERRQHFNTESAKEKVVWLQPWVGEETKEMQICPSTMASESSS